MIVLIVEWLKMKMVNMRDISKIYIHMAKESASGLMALSTMDIGNKESNMEEVL